MDSKETSGFIVRRVLSLCDEKGMSPYELAIRSALSPSTLHRILNGKNHNPGIATLSKICGALSISLREFWTSSALSSRL